MSAAAVAPDPEAFKKLFPDEYLQRFLAAGLRPDGRPLARPRPPTCAPSGGQPRTRL